MKRISRFFNSIFFFFFKRFNSIHKITKDTFGKRTVLQTAAKNAFNGDGATKPRSPNPIEFLFEADVELKNAATKRGQAAFMFHFNLRMDQHFPGAFVEGLQRR